MNLLHRKQIATILTAVGSIVLSAYLAGLFDGGVGFITSFSCFLIVFASFASAIMMFNGIRGNDDRLNNKDE